MSMTLTGDKVIERRLKKLPKNVQRNLARKSLRKALSFVRKDAKSIVTVDTGRLKKAIATKVSIKRNGYMTGSVYVRYSGKFAAPYAHLVEWGGENNTKTRFMTRTFEANKDKIIAEFRDQLIANIAKAGAL